MADSPNRSEELSAEKLAVVCEQYDAGYAARYRAEPMSVGATESWQAGWTDASRELGSFEESFTHVGGSLPFTGTGEEARRRGLPFDVSRSDAWKRCWIEADILLGIAEVCREV